MRDDPELIHAVIHALNEWMHETWPFDYQDRIFTTPVITLPIVERAIEELEWVVERGAKAVLHPPGAGARLPGVPLVRLAGVRPVLAGVVEAGILVVDARVRQRLLALPERCGSPAASAAVPADAFRMTAIGKRPIEDTMPALVCHGVFTRFPDLRIASIENGGGLGSGRCPRPRGHATARCPRQFGEDPVEAFRRNMWVSPFHEDESATWSRRSESTRSSSGRTTRTPRAWPSRSASPMPWTACPRRTSPRSWAAT